MKVRKSVNIDLKKSQALKTNGHANGHLEKEVSNGKNLMNGDCHQNEERSRFRDQVSQISYCIIVIPLITAENR